MTVQSAGVDRDELWSRDRGWKEREGLEKLEERYLRWVLGVERRTSGYLVREKLQREQLRVKVGKRAWGYEKRLEQGMGIADEIAGRC